MHNSTNSTTNQQSKKKSKQQTKPTQKNIHGDQKQKSTPAREKRTPTNRGPQIHIHQPPSHHNSVEDDDIFEVVENIQSLDMSEKPKKKRNRKKKNLLQPAQVESSLHPLENVEKADSIPIVDDEDDNQCSICQNDFSEDMSKVAHVKSCSHMFCYTCIKTWASDYHAKCPLCKVTIVTIVHQGVEERIKNSGVLVEEQPQQLAPINAGPLDCLDHKYFLSEVDTLFTEAKRIIATMERTQSTYNSNYRYTTRAKSDYQQRYLHVQEAVHELSRLKSDFIAKREFDPFSTLSQLYTIQDILHHETNNTQTSVYDDVEDDYDDYYDEDDELERAHVRYADHYY